MYHSSFHKNKNIRYEVHTTFTTSVVLNESEWRIPSSKDASVIHNWLKLVVNGTDSNMEKYKLMFEIATIGNTT